MFCEKCGQKKQDENIQFCSNCGANFAEEAPAPPPAPEPAPAPMPAPQQQTPQATYAPPPPAYGAPPPQAYQPPTDFGNLLASGNGMQSNATMMWAIYWGGAALLSIILAISFGITVVDLGWFGRTTMVNSWLYFWILIALGEIALGVLTILNVRKSRIDVFEKGIAGVGLSKFYFIGDIRTFPFKISHRDANVTGSKQEIMVTAPLNTLHLLHAQNAQQIREVAYQQKQNNHPL